jgi:hypothetical protein
MFAYKGKQLHGLLGFFRLLENIVGGGASK